MLFSILAYRSIYLLGTFGCLQRLFSVPAEFELLLSICSAICRDLLAGADLRLILGLDRLVTRQFDSS
jgi:hypothetical protein